ncbi:putative acetyltransferase [Microbacterium trichothecenolyticum]|uniref:GNAT family N-acetyltransferase n=1 Tax=Microbacterium trichothecenolyticum TaxID=69370 RepID=UPI0028624D1C|nr:GNAT family N-acetyltransferase [Microbacterium trichothecenolyticum]MDR7111564.1 putative acetyltransferase [Microbacterium trichothecenolyticum]
MSTSVSTYGRIGETERAAFRAGPVDEESAARLATNGLDYRRIGVDSDEYVGWLQSVARGFQDGERTAEQIAASRERSGYRRLTGVFDPESPMDAPVATIASWLGELTVPGEAMIPSCAISAVTVAPTHRRKGVARAMLEGELRAAQAAGIPMAMLTVSESPLYGRYGFAPAAAGASWTIETKRAGWIGPQPAGRIDFIGRERVRELMPALHERVRHRHPGEIDVPGSHWDGFAGTNPAAEKTAEKRAVQYSDAAGEVRGVAVYAVRENHDDFTKATVSVHYLLAETDDAYAALWRFLLELDLVAEVHAGELSVDEPLLWMIADQRAAKVSVRDHQYLRIIDVVAALETRRYGGSGTLVLDVSDSLGIASGRYLLEVDGRGAARVRIPGDGESIDAPTVALGVAELSATYLGGVSLATLAAAGRVTVTDASAEASADALAKATRVLGWHTAPRLSIWY